MQDMSLDFIASDPDADIDVVFSQLAHFQPPTNMVQRIMQQVAHIPLSQLQATWSEEEITRLAEIRHQQA